MCAAPASVAATRGILSAVQVWYVDGDALCSRHTEQSLEMPVLHRILEVCELTILILRVSGGEAIVALLQACFAAVAARAEHAHLGDTLLLDHHVLTILNNDVPCNPNVSARAIFLTLACGAQLLCVPLRRMAMMLTKQSLRSQIRPLC